MTKIKICGLSRPEDITIVNDAMPEYAGFVFAKSKRQVNEAQAYLLKNGLKSSIKTVGVFVNAELEQILCLCRNNIIDLVQLHGDETEDYLKALKSRIYHPIIRAVRVQGVSDIEAAQNSSADYLLFDTFKAGQYGGSGDTFDWSIISKISKPYFLAGGIHAENVEQAIKIAKPYAVDVSSGVETDGLKDRKKIINFVTKVRGM